MKVHRNHQTLCWALLLSVTWGCALTGQARDRERVRTNADQPRPPEGVVPDLEVATTKEVRQISFDSDESLAVLTNLAESSPPPEPDLPAPEATIEGLTLEAFEQFAMQNNPAIRQANAAISKAAGIRTQVGLKPNPSLGYFGVEIGNGDAAGLHGAAVTQTFVRGDKLAWNRDVIGHDVQYTRWLAEVQRVRVRNDVRIRFFAALGAQQRLELAREFRAVAEKGVEISAALVQMKEGARPDVLQSEVQLSEVELSIQRAEYDFMGAWNELAAIAGMPELTPTVLLGELKLQPLNRDLESAYAQIVAESPLLAAACAKVRRARANLQRQRVQPIPNVTARLGAGYDDGTGDEFGDVQLSVPLPIHNKNQGNVRAAYADYQAAIQNVNRLKMQIRRDLAQAMRAFEIARATVRQYESSILPKVGETLELIQRAQELGEFDFLRVLTARRAYFDANLKYVIALTDLAQATTKIEGLLLTGGLDQVVSYNGSDDLRGAALSVQ